MDLSGTTISTIGGDSLSLILELLDAHHLCKLLYTGNQSLWNAVISNCRTLRWSKPRTTRNPIPVKVPSFLPLLRNLRKLELTPFEMDGYSRAVHGIDPKTFSLRLRSLTIRSNSTFFAIAPATASATSSPSTGPSTTVTAPIQATPSLAAPKKIGFGFGFGLGSKSTPKPAPVFFTQLRERCPDLEELILEDKTAGLTTSPLPLPINLRILHLPFTNGATLEVIKNFPRGIVELKLALASLDPARAEEYNEPNSIFPPKLTTLELFGTIKSFVFDQLPPTITSFTAYTAIAEAQIAKLPPTLLALEAPMDPSMVNVVPRSLVDLSFSAPSMNMKVIKALPPGLTRFDGRFRSSDYGTVQTATDEYVSILPPGLESHIDSVAFKSAQLSKLPRRMNALKLAHTGDVSELAMIPKENLQKLVIARENTGHNPPTWLRDLPSLPCLNLLGLARFTLNADACEDLERFLKSTPTLIHLELQVVNISEGASFDFVLKDAPAGQLQYLGIRYYPQLKVAFDAPWASGLRTLVLNDIESHIAETAVSSLPASLTDFTITSGIHHRESISTKSLLHLPRKLESFCLHQHDLEDLSANFIKALPRTLTTLKIEWINCTVTAEEFHEHLPPNLVNIGKLGVIFPPL